MLMYAARKRICSTSFKRLLSISTCNDTIGWWFVILTRPFKGRSRCLQCEIKRSGFLTNIRFFQMKLFESCSIWKQMIKVCTLCQDSLSFEYKYKLNRCSKEICGKQFTRQVNFNGIMTKWLVQKQTRKRRRRNRHTE